MIRLSISTSFLKHNLLEKNESQLYSHTSKELHVIVVSYQANEFLLIPVILTAQLSKHNFLCVIFCHLLLQSCFFCTNEQFFVRIFLSPHMEEGRRGAGARPGGGSRRGGLPIMICFACSEIYLSLIYNTNNCFLPYNKYTHTDTHKHTPQIFTV